MPNERETKFAEFARLLYDDFLQLARDDETSINDMLTPDYTEQWRIKVEQLIAKRTYDLVAHALTYVPRYAGIDPEIVLETIPDLTALPPLD